MRKHIRTSIFKVIIFLTCCLQNKFCNLKWAFSSSSDQSKNIYNIMQKRNLENTLNILHKCEKKKKLSKNLFFNKYMISIKNFANLYIKVLQNYRLKNTLSNKTNCGRKKKCFWLINKKQLIRRNDKNKIPDSGNDKL